MSSYLKQAGMLRDAIAINHPPLTDRVFDTTNGGYSSDKMKSFLFVLEPGGLIKAVEHPPLLLARQVGTV